jgi:hypothetical protein
MEHDFASIRTAAARDGQVSYLVDRSPETLPPVSKYDLEMAWEYARQAALSQGWGVARFFRFRRPHQGPLDLALVDPDACCWAHALDGRYGLHTPYGLSLCLRLLALIDLLARALWARGLFHLARDGAELHPALLRAAALASLTAEARFDETALRARLAPLGLAAHSATAALAGPAGASA